MRKGIAIAGAAALVAMTTAPLGRAGPTDGFSSKNVKYVNFVPFETGTATGAAFVGKHMYVTGWKSFSIYNVSKPKYPRLLSIMPVGFQFENENVSVTPDGKYMLFSEQLPGTVQPDPENPIPTELHVYDVSDKTAPREIASLAGAGDHTMTCILSCNWAYGSGGSIVDLRDPKRPRLFGNWHRKTGLKAGAHDVEEFRRGFIVTSPYNEPLQIIDVRRPLAPKVVARGAHPAPENFIFHSGRWPRAGRDKFLLMQGEQNFEPRCDNTNGPFMTFSTRGWRKTHSVRLVDVFRLPNGTYTDGKPAVNGLGCSAHWFQENPRFHNGGLVAIGYYEHGVRFLHVNDKGKIHEAGYFLGYGSSASAAYWVTDRIVYSIDYGRGFDIVRYTGRIR
jgi:hypothetical protein